MPRLLYVSQLAGPEHPRRAVMDVERAEIPRVFSALGASVVVHDATAAPPPAPHDFDGVVVGGSLGSANDAEPWRIALRDWLATHRDIDLFGICGGHQLLAVALGGTVEVAPNPQMGVYPLTLPGVPGHAGSVVQMHSDRVASAPDGAEVWAVDAMGIQALRYGPRRWTFQFHPEIDRRLLEAAGTPIEDPRAWEGLDDAARGGHALLRAWLDGVRARLAARA
jgi:GMP synthase (glutamine-hydrolysing)